MSDLPTAAAPDGSPVAPYLLLPAKDEVALIHHTLPERAMVLDLGCGTGRVSRELAKLGHIVYAVDQSRDMIEHAPPCKGVEFVCADIEDLDVGMLFDGVVLASYLVNVTDSVKRSQFLDTCRRHVSPKGVVLIQRLDPQTIWAKGAESTFGSVGVRLVSATVHDQILDATIEYRIDGQIFTQLVLAEILDDQSMMDALGSAGLGLDRFLDEQRTWVAARPMTMAQ